MKRAEFLKSKRILYAVVDHHDVRNRNHLLFKKVLDLTIVLTQRLTTIVSGGVKYFDSVDEVMAQARGGLYDLIIIQSVGNFIIDYRFLDDLDEFCRSNSDFFLLVVPQTQLNCDDGGGAEFDCRMMVVNVGIWQRLGHPVFYEKKASTEKLADHGRLRGKVCGGSSVLRGCGLQKPPRSIYLAGGHVPVNAGVHEGNSVHCFPKSLVERSIYIWPQFESDRLYEGLVARDDSLVSHVDQKQWIRISSARSTIWIFNSEPYRFNIAVGQCDVYFGPAAGFKYLDLISYNQNIKFFFYDNNEDSLEWIRCLKSNWDGEDFKRYISGQNEELRTKLKIPNNSFCQSQSQLFMDFGGEANFKRLWALFRCSKAEFCKCDLFDSTELNLMISGVDAISPLFYYSNIFSTNFTLMSFSREGAEERYEQFKSAVKTKFPGAVMHGANVAGRWH